MGANSNETKIQNLRNQKHMFLVKIRFKLAGDELANWRNIKKNGVTDRNPLANNRNAGHLPVHHSPELPSSSPAYFAGTQNNSRHERIL